MIGFKMDEVMTGTHYFQDRKTGLIKSDLPFSFEITWGPDSVLRWLNPFGKSFLSQPLYGHMFVGEMCDRVYCMGTLYLEYWKGQIRYEIFFRHGGHNYKYEGIKKKIRPWNLHRTHTTCYGKIRDLSTGSIVSSSVVHFRLNTMPKFLTSFRLKKTNV